MKKFCKFIFLIPVCCCMLNISVYADTMTSQNPIVFADEGDISEYISPCSNTLQWYYKTENGKLYKRLFNTATNQWVGDWIYVKDI